MSSVQIPKSLKFWFVIHFIADIIFAIPMMFVPEKFLLFWGFETGETLTTRLVAAALFGIGGNSFLMKNKSVDSYITMLNLKIIWSISAILGITISIYQGAPPASYMFLAIFVSFSLLWIFYRRKL